MINSNKKKVFLVDYLAKKNKNLVTSLQSGTEFNIKAFLGANWLSLKNKKKGS